VRKFAKTVNTIKKDRFSMNRKMYEKIHQYSFENEKILEGQECVCLYCKSRFNYNKIKLWIEDEKGKTAQCPYCEIDCVVPISIENEYKLTDKDIENLNKIYF